MLYDRALLLCNSLPDILKQNCNSLLSFKYKFLVLILVKTSRVVTVVEESFIFVGYSTGTQPT